ncbi:MAG: hypothetical protein K2J15_00400, partial [Muribaculaceae bacterium]|nr:hypothetical protein [Muribaculaceae bacterium]
IKIITIISSALLTGIIVLWICLSSKMSEKESVVIDEGRIVDLRPIAELCSMEIYRESMVRDTLNGKLIYGIQKQQGRITFDLSGLPDSVAAASGPADSLASDTLYLKLPKEKIYLTEAAEKGAWRVIDTKSLSLLGSSKMTAKEENIVKRRAINQARSRLYKDGTVRRARREASETLRRLATEITGRPVHVTE